MRVSGSMLRPAAAALVLGLAGVGAPARAEVPPAAVGTIAPMLRMVTPAVVNIAVTQPAPQVNNPMLRDPMFRRFFNIPDEALKPQQAAGSGVIIDAAKGYVVTNSHVVEDAQDIKVTLKDQRSFKARLIGRDPDTDIALVQIPAEDLTALPLGDSEGLQVGDFVAAIGNPFGLGQTVTSGIISALGRSGLNIEGYEDFIQTDASINPGNSGGALVDWQGRLIGINTAILGPSGANIGIGFAVPVNLVKQVTSQLVAYGKVSRGRLGVALQELTPDIAQTLSVPAGAGGALIAAVDPHSPAAQAGLKQGDVVLTLDGRPLRGASDLRTRIGLLRVGTRVSLGILRKGQAMSLAATIAAEPKRRAASSDDDEGEQ